MRFLPRASDATIFKNRINITGKKSHVQLWLYGGLCIQYRIRVNFMNFGFDSGAILSCNCPYNGCVFNVEESIRNNV